MTPLVKPLDPQSGNCIEHTSHKVVQGIRENVITSKITVAHLSAVSEIRGSVRCAGT